MITEEDEIDQEEPIIVSKEDGTKLCVPVNIPFHENLMEELNTGKLILTALGLSKPNPTNPANCGGMTLLHVAAKKGYLNVCKLIAENVQEKNPEDCFGVTPIQLAAKNGHYEVCQLIISNVNEKNPAMHDGFTPLHIATKHGHYKICNLIGKNLWK